MVIDLRKETEASLSLCVEAAKKYPDDYDKALEFIKSKLKGKAGKREDRETKNGVIEVYTHGEAHNVGVMVEVLCETDFVAKNANFREFAHEVALQIAGMKPKYVSREDISESEIEELKSKWAEDFREQGKPENIIEKIVNNKLEDYYKQYCLLEQEYFKGEGETIGDMLDELKGKLGENIKITRFVRWEI